MNYKLYELQGEIFVEIDEEDLENYMTVDSNNQIRLKSNTVDKTYRLEVEPRYQALMMEVDPLVYEFKVNNGHNAFTNQQLKMLFADLDVQTINIHANIEAQLSGNQMNADGSPINKRRSDTANSGSVYSRYATNVNDDDFTIQGNYMTINGSNLPYSNKDSGSGLVGFAEAFEVVNVQVAIFSYNVYDTASILDSHEHITGNKVSMNNLQVIGNTTVPSINFAGTVEEILLQEQLMSRNSGGYIGIFIERGIPTYYNLNVGFTVIAIMNNTAGYTDDEMTIPIHTEINYVNLHDNWANSIYARNAYITISNSIIGQSGGSAIHMIDDRPSSSKNPHMVIKETTKINNWITGEEAWFKAYGMSSTALLLKSGIETAIAPTGRSVIQNFTNPITGLQSEMLNFIMLTEPSSSAITEVNNLPATGSELNLTIYETEELYTTINRSWNFLSSGDPRIDSGMYAFPIGHYSDSVEFMQLLGYISSIVPNNVPERDKVVSDLAMFAGFYNLSKADIDTIVALIGNDPNPIQTFMAGNSMNLTPPRYLEILSALPIYSNGYANVIMELGYQGN